MREGTLSENGSSGEVDGDTTLIFSMNRADRLLITILIKFWVSVVDEVSTGNRVSGIDLVCLSNTFPS